MKKSTFLKKLLFSLSIVTILLSCSVDDENYADPNADAAHGLIANVSPGSGNLFFFADANQVNSNPLTYNNAEGYYSFTSGDRVLSVKNAAGQTLATKSITMESGKFFSAFAVNNLSAIELVTYQDSLVLPATNMGRVRFINLSPDSGSIDFRIWSNNYAMNLNFKDASDFVDIYPSKLNGIIIFKSEGTSYPLTMLHQITNLEISAGGIYTVYTKGYITPTEENNEAFSVAIIRNY